MSRGPTCPVEQQDTDRIIQLLESILAEIKFSNSVTKIVEKRKGLLASLSQK